MARMALVTAEPAQAYVGRMGVLAPAADREHVDTLAAAAAGDEVAFRAIIAEHHEDMRRVCAYITGDVALAEEATQAAWVIAWQRLGDVNGPTHLRPWLVRVAANEAKQLLRQGRRRRTMVRLVGDATADAGAVDPATGIAALDLREALARMHVEDRTLLAMRYVAGFDSNELGMALGVTPAAVRQRLKRLLDHLREDLCHG